MNGSDGDEWELDATLIEVYASIDSKSEEISINIVEILIVVKINWSNYNNVYYQQHLIINLLKFNNRDIII